MDATMRGVRPPGGRRVTIGRVPRPEPGHGPEAYQGVIAGHEPCGEIVAVGPGCVRFGVGDRVILYHIAGCGVCHDCREGYMISCTSPAAPPTAGSGTAATPTTCWPKRRPASPSPTR